MSKEAEGATSEEGAAEEEGVTIEGEFDAERAKRTIEKQRQAEAEAKERVKELEAQLAEFKTAEEEEAEAQKKLEVKLAERDQEIENLKGTISSMHIKQDFMAAAQKKGIADPELAYVAAKEQGYLGEYDPKEGTVSDHDFDSLGEKYPSFKAEGAEQTGDAGRRGTSGKAQTVNDQFNQSIRRRLHGAA